MDMSFSIHFLAKVIPQDGAIRGEISEERSE
jgi:hypothetical protein